MSSPLDRAIEMMLTKIEHLRTELAAARAAERERCAMVCSDIARERAYFPGPELGPKAWRALSEAEGAAVCANAIRALNDGGKDG